ncbi:MAG: hypothetical protein CUN57_00425, partial [Phototrophicales bacterium]
ITIPNGSLTIASATTTLTLEGNVNSGGDDGVPSVAYSGLMYSSSTIIDANRATASTALTSLYDANGNALNLESGDTLTVGATKGAGTITTRTFTVGTTGTTLGDFREFIQHTFGIVADSNTSYNEGVALSGVSSGQTAGRLIVTSNIGDANAITEITISGTDAGGSSTLNTTAFQSIFGPDVGNNGFTQSQAADGESAFSQMTVYDSTGLSHTVDLIFSRASASTYSFFAIANDNFSAGSRGTSVRSTAGTLSFSSSGAFT